MQDDFNILEEVDIHLAVSRAKELKAKIVKDRERVIAGVEASLLAGKGSKIPKELITVYLHFVLDKYFDDKGLGISIDGGESEIVLWIWNNLGTPDVWVPDEEFGAYQDEHHQMFILEVTD